RRGLLDAVGRLSPKRLTAQAYVDGRLLLREQAFRRRWRCRAPILHVGHHEAHAASAFFASPFDEAAVLTLDRGGDFLSTTLSVGRGHRLRTLGTVRNPHSLGEVYSAFTYHLGFRPNSDEGKVMGLAPYGRNHLVPDVRQLVQPTPDGLFQVNLRWFRYQREGPLVSRRFERTFGPRRVPDTGISSHHEDLAYAVQDLTETAGLHVARALQRATGLRRLCLAGGVALNSVMNTRLLREAGFDDVFIQPAASDSGNALGAALWVWHHLMKAPRDWCMEHARWGPEFNEPQLERALQAASLPYRRVADPELDAAALLAGGRVVGRFTGRAEIGPRALGARSILADPRRPEMKDVVNNRVKRREPFRPFAPSVLHERGPDYFDGFHPTPFMLFVLPVRPEKRCVIPAVTHVDGTGRVQSVTRASDPGFHRLITNFERLTGVPVVLNTSFNVRGEPIVNTPQEAVADFVGTQIDALFLGPFLTEKAPPL
ncbi:MAG TPA: carbamoyltransferase C-terminal domain-containing protein, partial [Jiangellaceae bacterium]